ncbi:TolC family protein [Kineobactrum salinum]|uniref:TolC family protein n=1 Tax=Kineobactrum salinum TaxID=2708301 RepID=A0A6C0U3R1_9GAMM|nr:TolC family protein [Kineobactrum salinum]QIB65617.1 TolC family protein [Kineobactrum salinum]
MNPFFRAGRTGLAFLMLALAGCASAPPDDGSGRAQILLEQRGLEIAGQAQAFTGALSRQQAVQAMLLHHPDMRAEYARLDIAAADVVRASELLNPTLSLSWLNVSGGGSEFTVGLGQSLAGIMLRPARQRLAAADYELAVVDLAQALQDRALAVEAAWYQLAAAEQRLVLQQWASNSARWAGQLAQRFADAGNLPPLDQAEFAQAAAQAELDLIDARRDRDRAHEDLALLLALDHDDWEVTAALPLPVSAGDDREAMVTRALQSHPRLARLRLAVARLDELTGSKRREAWLDDAEVEIEHERKEDERATGPSLSFPLPLWHRNRSVTLAATAEYELLAAEEAALRLQLTRQLRQQLAELEHSRAAIEVRQQRLLPALAAEVEARQARVNFMLDGVFNLLASKRRELEGWLEQVEDLADYWQLEVGLAQLRGRAVTRDSEAVLELTPVGAATGEAATDEPAADPHRHHGNHQPAPTPESHRGHH